MPNGPDDAMLEPAHRIVAFVERGESAALHDAFTDDAVLVESVSPYVFEGRTGIDRWIDAMRGHVADHVQLRAELGRPQEHSRAGDRAFYSLPIRWHFAIDGREVDELGAMALVIDLGADGRWRVARYAWAVAGSTA